MESQSLGSFLPDDFDGRASLIERFQDDPVKAIQSYQALEKKMGTTTRVPGDGAAPDEWDKFHKKMGVPEDATGYGVPDSKDQFISQLFTGLRPVAKEAGIPKAQFDRLVAAAAEMGNTRADLTEKQRGEAKAQAQAKLSEAFGENLETAQTTAADMLKKLSDGAEPDPGMLDNPNLVKALLKVSEIVSEDELTSGLGGVPDKPNPVEIAARGREIVESGELENRQNANRKQLYAEYLDILSALEAQGFNSLDDARLMPEDPFARYR